MTELELLGAAGGGAGLGLGAMYAGKALLEYVRSRASAPKQPAAEPPRSDPPRSKVVPTVPAQCSPGVERHVGEIHAALLPTVVKQVNEVHEIVALREDDGASVLIRTLRATAENTDKIHKTLERISSSFPRPPMGSSPGAAE